MGHEGRSSAAWTRSRRLSARETKLDGIPPIESMPPEYETRSDSLSSSLTFKLFRTVWSGDGARRFCSSSMLNSPVPSRRPASLLSSLGVPSKDKLPLPARARPPQRDLVPTSGEAVRLDLQGTAIKGGPPVSRSRSLWACEDRVRAAVCRRFGPLSSNAAPSLPLCWPDSHQIDQCGVPSDHGN